MLVCYDRLTVDSGDEERATALLPLGPGEVSWSRQHGSALCGWTGHKLVSTERCVLGQGTGPAGMLPGYEGIWGMAGCLDGKGDKK